MQLLPEPWRVKVVEPIRLLGRAEREERLAQAGFNLFHLRSEDVFIDLFTDSGTSAMSDSQWAGLMQGDEAYAGARNFFHFRQAVEDIFGFPQVLPVHQGRAAENLLFAELVRPGMVVPGNSHFDTTRAHIELNGGQALDLPVSEARDPAAEHPFKGNIDLEALRRRLHCDSHRVPLVVLTLTNNLAGGQPVSMANLRGTAALCREFGIPLYLDACRFAENAWFIREREEGQHRRTVAEIAREMFELADGCTMSAKKDGLVNIGGFLATRDADRFEKWKARLLLYEGFPTYGGLSGRDLEAMARGLREVLDEEYLRFRVAQVARFGERLADLGVPIIRPPGGHAVYVDARRWLSHLPPERFPAQTLAVALFREGGIRASEIGGVMLAHVDPQTGRMVYPPHDLMRLAVPRRVYTDGHLEYVADTLARIGARKERLRGLRLIAHTPVLRHFTASFEECS